MAPPIQFCVLYRFKVRPGMEAAFQEGWTRITEAIRDTQGGLGSRLHRTADGWWAAYAQWPDRATWQAAQTSGAPLDPEAVELMRSSIEKRAEPLELEPVIDLLELGRAGEAAG
jgi:quinol monooxygenase YgiN